MSREISIYTKREEPIDAADLLSRLRAEGIAAEWRQDPFFSSPEAAEAFGVEVAAEVVPHGSDDPADVIALSSDAFNDPDERDNVVEVHADDMSPAHRRVVLAARRKYSLSTGWLPNPRRGALLASLAALIAELGDGVLVDTETNHFYTADEYRRHGPNRAASTGGA